MRRWTFRGVLSTWALGLAAAGIVATAAVSWAQMARLAREEALARVERAVERAADARSRALDPAFFEEGTEVRIAVRTRAEIDGASGDPRIPLWRAALDGRSASAVLGEGWGAIAVRRLDGDPPAGVLEAQIPANAVAAPLRRFTARVLGAATLVALLAAVAAAILARRIGGPLEQLARAAERMGQGDLRRPVTDPGGLEVGALASTLERMRLRLADAGAEIESRRSDLEAVVAGIAEGVIAVDRERRVRFLSPPAAALLGIDPDSAAGRFCGDLLRPEPVAGVRPCEDSCPILHARFRGPARAIEYLGAAGPRRAMVVSSSAPAGGLQVLIVRQETSVEAAGRARDSAVADLAHELQTPLAAQHASLELLRDRLADTDRPALELVLALETGTARLRRLIDNLLESVRIESGQLAIRRVAVDLDEVVEEAVAMTRPLLDRRGQTLALELPHPMPEVLGDPQRLAQVLVNLIANASKFGPERSTVRVGAELGSADLELWVEDEGPGFAAERRASEPGRFRRGGDEPHQEGSGLGLWICRSILERHGGGLSVARAGERTRVVARLARTAAA